MKNTLLLIFFLVGNGCFAQKSYWQQETNFTITVSLNDVNHTLEGFETIKYTNHSPDTLSFIWFHLWPNAYKNDRTDFSEQLLNNGRTDFYFSKAADKGYINRLDFTADNVKAALEFTPQLDIVKLVLPKPLAPKQTTNISTPFHVQLPYNFSRGGHIGNSYQVTQWFPKPAVYDGKGWHAMPYLDQGEFYSEFGSYDVQITLPPAYNVAATGKLQNLDDWESIKKTGKPVTANTNRTWHYRQNAIHDFAWFASKDLVAHYDTTLLPGGKTVDILSYYKTSSEAWKKSLQYAKDGLQYYSSRLGDYPYDVVSIVEGAENVSSGGMEYPAITLITTNETGRQLDATIVHEIGHNWFYGALASNERMHPWMDEGMNTYYQNEYEVYKYGSKNTLQANAKGFANKLPADEEKLLLQTMIQLAKDEPIDKPATSYSSINYGLSVYVKGAAWMKQLETKLGKAVFDSSMRAYYSQYQFKHPYPNDFRKSIESSTHQSLAQNFNQLNTTGALDNPAHRTIKPSLLFNLKETDRYNYINLAPAFGYNRYDKIMAGVLIHNYQLPLNKFNFLAGGLYGSGSKKLNGFGRASYTSRKKYRDVEAAISLFNFSKNDFSLIQNKILYPRIRRIVPSIKVTLYDKDPSYTRSWTFAFKTFLLKEDELKFSTTITGTDTVDMVALQTGNTTINRLSVTYADNRVLYPYSVNLLADQGKDFLRAGLTANYFFNYADNKSGLKARLFAGKFFYLKSKTLNTQFSNDRYALNMTGANGNEDYTYSNYFIGRNEFEDFMSQQIMERDGFFKVRTDFLSDKIGKTDDWLVSINLVTDLPDKINPLQVLPFKIPLKVFVDVGTYAGAWKENPSTGRFLYDAGLQIPLFGSIVNIYIPILYSKVYSNYFKSTITEKRFLKNISFSIDVQKLQSRKIFKGIPI